MLYKQKLHVSVSAHIGVRVKRGMRVKTVSPKKSKKTIKRNDFFDRTSRCHHVVTLEAPYNQTYAYTMYTVKPV